MAALDEFYLNGFKAAQMAAVAQRVGISKGALYLYFSSKEEVFRQLIVLVAEPKMEMVEAFMQRASTAKEGLSHLLGVMPMLVRQSPLPKVLKVLLSDAFTFPAVVEHYRQSIIQRALTAISGLLERSKEAGEITIGDPDLTARLVVSPLVMSVVWTVVFEAGDAECNLDLDAFFHEHQTLLFRALGISEDEPS